MRVVAIVVAGGQGTRVGGERPKALLEVAGRTLLGHAVAALAEASRVDGVLPVLPAGTELPADAATAKSLPPVPGGTERQDSVAAGVNALPDTAEWVAVHDAARALVRPAAIDRVVEAAQSHGAALLAVPVADTLKRVEGTRVVESPPRESFWAAQTPQVFRVELLREALDKARAEGRQGTDCAQLVAALGVPVEIVEGDRDNWKITYPEDLEAAGRILGERA
ncbi:MAG: 2-C-methyl-D-erythritol 4-phosphate cytidylyltransferase [Myxococcota bacterium]